MELGALVCLPKNPNCSCCPLRRLCEAHHAGKVEKYPTPQKKSPTQKVFLEATLIEKNGFYLLAKRNGKKQLQSMWEFPQAKPSSLDLKTEKIRALPVVRHAIMNQSIRLMPSLYRFVEGEPKSNRRYVAYQWIKPADLKKFPTSSINNKIAAGLKYFFASN